MYKAAVLFYIDFGFLCTRSMINIILGHSLMMTKLD